MKIEHLFLQRVWKDWKFQWKVSRMAIDWTVAVYIVIPAILFLGYHYYLWWVQPVDWSSWAASLRAIGSSIVEPGPALERSAASLPQLFDTLLLLYLFILSCTGKVRYYIEGADQLFLYQRSDLFGRLMSYGLSYSLFMQACFVFSAILLIYPLIRWQISLTAIGWAWLALYTYLFRANTVIARQWLELKYSGWRLSLANSVGFLSSGILFLLAGYAGMSQIEMIYGAVACLTISLLLLIRNRLRRAGAFYADVDREQRYRWRFAAFLLAQIIEKKRSRPKRRPFLWRRSQIIFEERNQVNGLAELGIKSFFRNRTGWFTYLRLVLMFSFIILVLPAVLKTVAWVIAGVIIAYWLRMMSQEVESSPFLKMFVWKEGVKLASRKKIMFALLLPSLLWLSALVGWFLFAGLGILIALLCGAAMTGLFAKIFSY